MAEKKSFQFFLCKSSNIFITDIPKYFRLVPSALTELNLFFKKKSIAPIQKTPNRIAITFD